MVGRMQSSKATYLVLARKQRERRDWDFKILFKGTLPIK
jgi:hypothetical protein